METKEVTLRQCRYCEKEFNNQDVFCHLEYNVCVRCKVGHINHDKKQAGDKTEFVLIEKPRDQRLGQVMMNGYRDKWQGISLSWDTLEAAGKEIKRRWDKLDEKGRVFYGSYRVFANILSEVKYWDIWEQDTPDIQEKINKLTS